MVAASAPNLTPRAFASCKVRPSGLAETTSSSWAARRDLGDCVFVRRVLSLLTLAALAVALGAEPSANPALATPATAKLATPTANAATVGMTAATAAIPVGTGGMYRSLRPTRILDTRIGLGAGRAAVRPRAVLPVRVLGRGGLPRSGASAVLLTVHVTAASAGGWLTAYGAGFARPAAAMLDFTRGVPVSNSMTVMIGKGGIVNLYNGSAGSTHIAVDVSGYYVSGAALDAGSYSPLAPSRVLDTRSGLGAARRLVRPREVVAIRVAGAVHVPIANVASVVLSLHVTSATAAGSVIAYASGMPRPAVSSLDFYRGRTVSNTLVVPVGADGRVDLYNGSAGRSHLIADLIGFYQSGSPTAAGSYRAVPAARLLDTRIGLGAVRRPVPTRGVLGVQLAGRGGLPPAPGTSGVVRTAGMSAVLNVRASSVTAGGGVTAYPAGTSRPGTAVLDFARGVTATNLVTVPIGANGMISLYNASSGNTELVVDVVGYLRGPVASWRTFARIDPSSGQPTSVSCSSPSFCALVDFTGHARLFSGAGWSAPASVTQSAALLSVSCVSASFCAATDDAAGTALFNGNSWLRYPSVLGSTGPSAVSCAASNFCVAISGNSVARWGGSSWSSPQQIDPPTAGGGLTDISCPVAGFCVAVDAVGRALSYDGTSWSATSDVFSSAASGIPAAVAVSCVSASYCVAVQGAETQVFDGASWQATALLTPGWSDWGDLACAAVNGCVGVDVDGRQRSFDGVNWSAPALIDGNQHLVSVSCPSTTFCLTADRFGYASTLVGQAWSTPVLADQNSGLLSAVSCPSATFCATVDRLGAAVTYSAGRWNRPVSINPHYALSMVSCTSAAFCVAAGSGDQTDAGDTVVLMYNGRTWTRSTAFHPDVAVTGLSCLQSWFCVAVRHDGSALMFNGSSWSTPTLLSGAFALSSVSCVARTFCEASNGYTFWTYNGSGWAIAGTVGNHRPAGAVSCATATHCAATTDDGYWWRFDGRAWSIDAHHARLPGPAPAQSLSCPSTDLCVVPGAVFNGRSWTSSALPEPPETFNQGTDQAVSCASDTFCVSVRAGYAFLWS
ncbi:MAG: hypothetical protein JWN95_2316 [Frankiales bacterium]|nr:hypothetical protein [Frankiales bacterium]